MVTKRMGDRYVLGFASALRLLPGSNSIQESVQILYKCPLDETEVPRVSTHATRSHTHVRDPVVHVRVQCA